MCIRDRGSVAKYRRKTSLILSKHAHTYPIIGDWSFNIYNVYIHLIGLDPTIYMLQFDENWWRKIFNFFLYGFLILFILSLYLFSDTKFKFKCKWMISQIQILSPDLKKKIKTHVGSVNKKHGSANSSFIESMIVRLNWIWRVAHSSNFLIYFRILWHKRWNWKY